MGRGGWVGAVCTFWYECPLVVLACESLHVCTVCIWRCEHTRFCVEVFYALYINFHSFIHSFIHSRRFVGISLANQAGLEKAPQWVKIWSKSFQTKTSLDFCYTLSLSTCTPMHMCAHTLSFTLAPNTQCMPTYAHVYRFFHIHTHFLAHIQPRVHVCARHTELKYSGAEFT